MHSYSVLNLLVAVVIIGFVCWLLMQIPMPEIFRKVAYGIMIVAVVLWAISVLAHIFPVLH